MVDAYPRGVGGLGAVALRQMTTQDVPRAEEIGDEAFHQLDRRWLPRSWPEPTRRTPEHSAGWIARTTRLLATDGAGCWVAEHDGEVVGFATSLRRERLWILATFAVRPGLQGRGVGGPLLDRAAAHGAGCDRAMLAASDDPRALRRYWRAGFSFHPQLMLHGQVDRTALPTVEGLREGTDEDLAWMDELDRDLRGGPHGPDHVSLASGTRLVVSADRTGYAYASSASVQLLAARDATTASTLLWECLAGMADGAEVAHVTAANPWAVDVGQRAGLSLTTRGHLALRGMDPPAPYVHNGALL